MEENPHPVHLQSLDIENFKSYRGNIIVGPLRNFTAVIGPNGTGKSNFMDAISFVFGEQARSLRVKKLHELIHGSNVDQATATKCSVTAVLMVNGEEKRYQRIVKVSGNDAVSDYRIDGKSVGNKQYMESLEELNIVIKPRNFLVFQGQIEQIATMNPKQRTALLEKISRSGELKEEYDRLEKELEVANEDHRKAFNKKKETAGEEKDAKEDKKLADEYQKKIKDLDREKAVLQLFELYHKDREMEDIKKEVRRQKQTQDELEKERKELDENLKSSKKKLGEKTRELNQLDQETRISEVKLSQARPELISLKAKIEHLQAKISSDERMLTTLTTSQENLTAEIQRLEEEKSNVEAAKRDFTESWSQAQESQNLSQLTSQQLTEYHGLKQEAARQMNTLTQEMETVRRENKKDKDNLAADRAQLEEVTSQLKIRRNEREGFLNRIERLQTKLISDKAEKEKLEAACSEMDDSLEGLEDRIKEVEDKMTEIRRKFAEMRVDERELGRKAKKEELINKLKQLYGDDVLGRLIDLCHHSHERYKLAVTKVLGKYMNGIIVSTTDVASKCIAYMKQQEIEPELFIPLNNITVKPVAERLRELDPDTVKLLVDVIQIDHMDKGSVQKALRFACGSTVTCQDVDKARRFAYRKDEPLQVVTWSGTLFDKNGIISGGAAELKSKARRWDEKDTAKLKLESTELSEQLRELLKVRRKEADLSALKSQIKGIEARLKYAAQDKKEAETSSKEINRLLADQESKHERLTERVKAAEEKSHNSEQRLKALDGKLNNLEDTVFAEFCEAIGVSNIRQYEAREMSERQERDRKVLEFDNQINRLGQKLTYEKSKFTKSTDKLERCAKELEKIKKDLIATKSNETEIEKKVEAAEKDLAELKAKKDNIKTVVDERETEVEEHKKDLSVVAKKLASLNRLISAEETKREQLRLDRRAILQHCKLNNVELPFERGSMDDVALVLAAQDTTVESSQDTINSQEMADEREAQIKLDYSKLAERLKRQTDHADIVKESTKMQERIREFETAMDVMTLPKANATERLGEMKTKVKQSAQEMEETRSRVVTLTNQFDRVKKERLKRFSMCLETVASSIDQIYKELVNESSAQAHLEPDNPESPFSGGIIFSLVVPGKNYRTIDSLSGGEKTLASLSLLFAIHAAHPSPFFIMDEVDAALDNTNILRVARFMQHKSMEDFQIIIISLKEEMYHHVDALVGIYSEPADVCVSKNLTLDMSQFEKPKK